MKEIKDSKEAKPNAADANDIRRAGWMVAIHNDYTLDGVIYTFWLFTKEDRCVKGEGVTDAMALNEVRKILGLTHILPTDEQMEPLYLHKIR